MTTPAPDNSPLWLKIVLGVVPLVAALVAGIFLLANTVSRRIERLKNLVEVREKFPEGFNEDRVLERIMFRELRAIDFATTPVYSWLRRLMVLIVILYVSAGITKLLSDTEPTPPTGQTRIITTGIAFVLGAATANWFYRRRALKAPHDQRLKALELSIQNRKESDQSAVKDQPSVTHPSAPCPVLLSKTGAEDQTVENPGGPNG